MTARKARRRPALPGILADIAALAGETAALQLAAARGGTRVYLPARAADGHWLVAAVGRPAADLICREFGGAGTQTEIPLGPVGTLAQVRRRIGEMEAEGCSEREIATALGIAGRTVRRRRAARRGDSRQGKLL
jgi:DNA-binding NarL/FixJ family response regulator